MLSRVVQMFISKLSSLFVLIKLSLSSASSDSDKLGSSMGKNASLNIPSDMALKQDSEKHPSNYSKDLTLKHNPLTIALDGFLGSIQLALPLDISKLIMEYDNTFPLELYEKVMNRLNLAVEISSEEWETLNFFKGIFAFSLRPILNRAGPKIPVKDPFWNDLDRLLFKWLIHTRQVYSDNPVEFESVVKDLNRLPSFEILAMPYWARGGFSRFEEMFQSGEVHSLLYYEILENLYMVSILASATQEFYNSTEKSLVIACNDLKNNYFSGKNFNDNALLKIMIYNHDPYGEMKKCFLIEEKSGNSIVSNDSNDHDEEILLLLNTTITMRTIDIETFQRTLFNFLANIVNLNLIDNNTMKLFIDSGVRFHVSKADPLVLLLSKLEGIDGLILNKDILERTIGFNTIINNDVEFIWNKKTFELYLDLQKSNPLIKDKCKFYKNLINN